MTDLDKMARGILAAEYKRVGGRDMAVKTLAGQCDEGASMRAARAALLAAPPGWKLVPVEPTQEMLDEVCSPDGIEPWTDDVMASTYRAMIAAAPEVKR